MIHATKRHRNDPPPRGYYLPPEPEPAPGPSWADLVRVAPALQRYEVEAAQLAGSAMPFIRWQLWLRTYAPFTGAVGHAAESVGVSFNIAMDLALDRLAAVYRRARRP